MIENITDVELLLEKALVAEINRIDYQGRFNSEISVEKFLNYLGYVTMGRGLSYLKTTVGLKEIFGELGESLWLLEALENISQAFYYQYYLYMGEKLNTRELKKKIAEVIFGLGTDQDEFNSWTGFPREFEPVYQKLHERHDAEGLFKTFPWMAVIYLLAVFQTVQKIEQAAETTRSNKS